MKPAHTPGPVRIVKSVLFAEPCTAQARLEMRTDGARWSVIRVLPAGMDIGPDHWTWRDEDSAMRHFACLTEWFELKGFKAIKDNANPNAGAAQAYPAGRWTGGAK